jgi:hypothetical protein
MNTTSVRSLARTLSRPHSVVKKMVTFEGLGIGFHMSLLRACEDAKANGDATGALIEAMRAV